MVTPAARVRHSRRRWILRCRGLPGGRTQVGAHPSVAAEAEVATAEAVHVANEAEPCRDIVDAVVGKAADQHGVGREPVETGVETLDLIERPVKIECRSEEQTSELQSIMRIS